MENQKFISKAQAMASAVKTAYIGSIGEEGYPYVKGMEIRGRMDVVDDAESRRVVWHEGDESCYPQGVDDTTFKVLRFTPERGRLNDSKGTHEFVIEQTELTN